MKRTLLIFAAMGCAMLVCGNLYAEAISPIAVTGYNVDGMWGPDGGNGGGYCEDPGYTPYQNGGGGRLAFFINNTVSKYAATLTGGLPGTSFASAADATHTYAFAPAGGDDVASDNLLRIDSVADGTANTGTLTLATPGLFSSIGILANTFHDPGTSSTQRLLSCTLNFADSTTQTATYDASEFKVTPAGSTVALTATLGARDISGSLFPNNDMLFGTAAYASPCRFFETVIAIDPANQGKMLTSITFTGVTGAIKYSTDIYALSGAAVPEPGTLALLAGSLLGLICYAWRKK